MFDYSPAEIASVFSSFAQPSAPLLECLVVKARHEENDRDSRLPGDVIWRDLPSLRYLAFTSIFIPTRFSLLPQLTELTLQTRLLTVTWFLEVLANAPMLQRIFVCGLRSDEDIPCSTKQISLPSLASLQIYMSTFKPLNMFDFITLAPTTYIYLYLCNFPPQQGPSTEPWRAASLRSLLSRRLKGIEYIDSLTLGIRYCPTTEFYISISTPIKQYTDLTLPMVTQSHADACVRLFESLPITKVTSLHLSDYMKPEVPWSRLISLPLFEKIQALHVSYPFMNLIDDMLYNEDPSKTPFRFANLVDIFFLRDSYSSSHLSSKFKAMIRQRKEIGKIVRVHQ
ncbi:hypothetical protein ONZ45_g12737 [Pleurotus djamor]|nr:hypothetical protein ONZ45_g12737 [Pleurotus djamor]